jgi:branched-chain amino acid transport system permease protein
MLTILLDGVAYGMLLFVLSVGLSVTLGLMNFINLAHGVFAMLGGYCTALLMNRAGVPFLATLPLAFWFQLSSGWRLSERCTAASTAQARSIRCFSRSASC